MSPILPFPDMQSLCCGLPRPRRCQRPHPSAGYYAVPGRRGLEGSVSAAIAGYQRALDLDPHQTELYLELARLLIYNGQAERGLEMARQALTRQPENGRAWALLGLACDWLGMTGQAVAYCQKAVELRANAARGIRLSGGGLRR